MMAVGTGQPLTHEHLTHIIHEILGCLDLLVPNRRRRFRLIAHCTNDIADELIVRLVGSDRFPNPGVERERAISPVRLISPLDTEDVGPLVGEIVGVFGTIQRSLSTSLSRAWRDPYPQGMLESPLCGIRKRARDIEVNPTDEYLIRTQFRWRNVQLSPLLGGRLVDDVLFGELES